jgi:hypothetical protein
MQQQSLIAQAGDFISARFIDERHPPLAGLGSESLPMSPHFGMVWNPWPSNGKASRFRSKGSSPMRAGERERADDRVAIHDRARPVRLVNGAAHKAGLPQCLSNEMVTTVPVPRDQSREGQPSSLRQLPTSTNSPRRAEKCHSMWNCLLKSLNILFAVEALGYKPHDGMAEEACTEMLRQRPLWLGPSACTSEPFGKTRSSKCGNHEDHLRGQLLDSDREQGS